VGPVFVQCWGSFGLVCFQDVRTVMHRCQAGSVGALSFSFK
jgi:hypothetical protein